MQARLKFLLLNLSIAFCTNPVFAQEVASPVMPVKSESVAQTSEQNAEQSVEITNAKNPEWKSYRSMLKGLDAFDRYRAMAPLADAKFELKPRRDGITLEGVNLSLKSDDSSRPIPLDADGYFVLPRDAQAEADNADLMINRKKDLYRWRPAIRTPALPDDHLRLGDLRLMCEMEWAIEKDGAPFVFRMYLSALGGFCQSKKVTVEFATPYLGARSVTLVQADRRLDLALDKNRTSFILPIYDRSYSDDAIIEIVYDETNLQLRKRNFSGINVSM